jgi:hypothetical protein
VRSSADQRADARDTGIHALRQRQCALPAPAYSRPPWLFAARWPINHNLHMLAEVPVCEVSTQQNYGQLTYARPTLL